MQGRAVVSLSAGHLCQRGLYILSPQLWRAQHHTQGGLHSNPTSGLCSPGSLLGLLHPPTFAQNLKNNPSSSRPEALAYHKQP